MVRNIIVSTLLIVLFFSSIVYAEAPRLLNFQGRLLDSGGKPLSGPYSMAFSIYNSAVGGSALWTETQSVSVQDGIYNVSLGAVSPLNMVFNEPYYLEVKIGAETLPRQPILSSAYALNSERLGGIASDDFLRKDPNGAVKAAQFQLPGGGFWTEDSNTHFTFRTTPNKSMFLDFGDTLQFRDSGELYAGRFFIDTNGNVGIGTTAPGARLDVNGALVVRMGSEDLNPCRISGFGNPHNYMDIQSGRGKDGTYRDIRIATGAWPNWNGDQLYLKGNGNVGIGTYMPTAKLDVNADTLRLRTNKTPSRPTDTGNKGDICWDSNYIYVCVDTNTWKRSSLSSW